MFENVVNFFKNLGKKEKKKESSDTAKERLHLVLMQDRANVSADFLELMKQEIIEVIKKYIDIDEKSIDVRLTNKTNDDGTVGAPALYANIPIVTIKNEARVANVPHNSEKKKEAEVEKQDNSKSEKKNENKEKSETKVEKESKDKKEDKKVEDIKPEEKDKTEKSKEIQNKDEKEKTEKTIEEAEKLQDEVEDKKVEENKNEEKNSENKEKEKIENKEEEKI